MKAFLTIALCCCVACVNAQTNIYLKDNGRRVAVRDSADFIRIIDKPQPGFVNYKLIEYYPNNNLRTVGTVSKYEPSLVYEGIITRFNHNGRKKQIILYQKGKKTGSSIFYYPNGKKRKTISYDVDKGMADRENSIDTKWKLIDFYDSTGVKIVENGTGAVKDFDDEMQEEGMYTDGVKTGEWKGANKKYGFTFEEEYDGTGKLISGVSVKDGSSFSYKNVVEDVAFVGGASNFAAYLRKFKYPRSASENGIKGTVSVGFIIGKDGKVSNLHIIKSLNAEIDAEAIRLLGNSPLWIPAKLRGIPQDIYFIQPITLNLTTR